MEIREMCLGEGPTFNSHFDEEMFFKAIYSMHSYIEIKGAGSKLFLSFNYPMNLEDKKLLIGLLQRYNMSIPDELTS